MQIFSTKDKLVATALKLFYQYGFHATEIGRILQEAGVTRKELYEYFRSKDELIAAALLVYHDQFLDQLNNFIPQKNETRFDRMLAVFDFVEQWFHQDYFYGCIFINAIAEFSDRSKAIHEICRKYKQSITTYFKHLAEEENAKNPDELAENLSLLIEGATVTTQVSGKKNCIQQAKSIASLILQEEFKTS